MNIIKTWLMVVGLIVGLTGCASRDDGNTAVPATQPGEAVWSEPVDGLRGRIVLFRQRIFNGTAIIGTKLELRNDGGQTLVFPWPLVWAKGTVFDAKGAEHERYMGPYSGLMPEQSDVVIAPGETAVIEMTTSGMGVGADMAGAMEFFGGCWEFPSADMDYTLAVAVFTGPDLDEDDAEPNPWPEEPPPPPPPGSVVWSGRLELPHVQIPLKPDPLPPNVGELIEQLGAEMLEKPWGEATDAMSLIDDERVIPWYVKLAATRDSHGKREALSRLSRFDTDAALEGIRLCMAVRGEDIDNATTPAVANSVAKDIRRSAAYALDRCRHPQAKALLWTMRNDFPLFVMQRFAEQDMDEPTAREMADLIELLLNDPNPMIQREAKRIQELRLRRFGEVDMNEPTASEMNDLIESLSSDPNEVK